MNTKTFCVAPWIQTCIRTNGALTPCCQWKATSTTNFRNFDQWINSDEMRNAREKLHHGIELQSCSRCWSDEKAGKKSLRQTYNSEFFQYFDYNDLDKINWLVKDSTVTFDLKLSNLCNLKCAMCSPLSSSQLMTEYQSNKEKFDRYFSFETDIDFNWPLSSDFSLLMDRFLDNVRWIKFTGGEPTIVPYVIDVLDKIKNPETVTVSFTTNGTRITDQFLQSLKKFKTLWISVSLEGIGTDNDNIRYLSNWDEIEKNILKLKTLSNAYLTINHVFQCFSIKTLVPLLKWCDEHGLKLNLIKLDKPNYLGANSLSPQLINNFIKNFKELTFTVNGDIIDIVIGHLKDYTYDQSLDQQRVQYLNTLDQIRNTKLATLFGEQQ